MKTRIIKTVFHGTIPSEGLISLTIPADMSAERLISEVEFWTGIVSKQDYPTQQDFTKALLTALCNAIPAAKWESVTPFATFEFDEIG